MRGGGKEEDEIEEAAESSPYDGLPTAAVASYQGANTLASPESTLWHQTLQPISVAALLVKSPEPARGAGSMVRRVFVTRFNH